MASAHIDKFSSFKNGFVNFPRFVYISDFDSRIEEKKKSKLIMQYQRRKFLYKFIKYYKKVVVFIFKFKCVVG